VKVSCNTDHMIMLIYYRGFSYNKYDLHDVARTAIPVFIGVTENMIASLIKRCCFTTVVYGWYKDFIPIYIYSILKSFPQHYVKIFLKDKLDDHNTQTLRLVKDRNDQFEIVENFTELDWCQIPHLAALRFLLTREYFQGFEYVYFGDVDFLIYNIFKDNFVDTYIRHCDETGLPFSNGWNYKDGKHRVAGTHFVVKDLYFDAMDKIIEEVRQPDGRFRLECECECDDTEPTYDEEMLFYMTSEVFDLRSIKNYYSPRHGVHFGTYRHFMDRAYLSNYRAKALSDDSDHADMIFKLYNDDLFSKLYSTTGSKAKVLISAAFAAITRKIYL
jgi:hypothetical protein